jgi:pimeloyl-ACP methyl ester carboxylesterase
MPQPEELERPPDHVVEARGDVAVWEWGAGPAVLLVHGFPDHAIGMAPFGHRLAKAGYRVVCPALPGYPPSAPVPDGDYGVGAVGDDLLAVLDALGEEQACLVGHDWGAEIGYRLASSRPDRITTLVALGAPHPAGYAIRRTVFDELRSAWYAIFLAYHPAAPAIASSPTWLTALVQSWSPGFHWDGWPSVRRLIAREDVMRAVCRYYRCDLDADLETPVVRVPSTIVHGAQDGCIRPVTYEGIERWFEAGLRRRLLPAAGHWPHLEAPEEALEIVLEALGPAPAPPSAESVAGGREPA